MPSVSTAYVHSIVSFLNNLGFDEHPLLVSLNKNASDITQSRVAMNEYISLLNMGAKLTQNTLFGFELGKHIQPKDYGVLGYLVESCENLDQAINALTRFDALVADIGITKVQNDRSYTRIEWVAKSDDCKQMVLRNTTAWVATVSKIIGQVCKAQAVSFTFSLSANEKATLEAWFRCEVTGNSHANTIIFPRALLHIPFSSENKAVFKALMLVSENELRERKGHEEIKNKVIALLKANTTLKDCNQQRVAKALFISPRTLQRKLKLHGTHFQKLLTEERKARLDDLLKTHSIADTADLLGFQEQSSFTHAFKKWFSTTPRAYQKKLLRKDTN
jgi:AraC-like DNA-binding protein